MANRRYNSDEAPYKQSRAALRERYGSRSIDASAPQSDRDFTPSGRLKYRMEQDTTPVDPAIKAALSGMSVDQQFRDNFRPRSPGFDPAAMNPVNSPWQGVITWRGAIPVPDEDTITQPTAATPLAFNLREASPYSASDIAPYAQPSGAVPAYVPSWRKKQQQSGYMGSILGGPSRWLT